MQLSKIGATIGALATALALTGGVVLAAENLVDLQHGANVRIQARLDILNRLQSRVEGDKKLSSGQQSALVAEVQSAVSGLTSLKSKIDSDTTATQALQDIKQIGTYKAYEVIAPQVREEASIDNLQALSAQLSAKVPQWQTDINNLQSQGKNVSQLQSQLNDISSRLNTVNGLLANDASEVAAVNTSSTNASTTFKQVRTDLSTVHSNVQAMRTDLRSMAAEARSLG